MFELTLASAPEYLVRRGIAPAGEAIEVAELVGGVSATVISARIPSTGTAVVVKQALQRLKVEADWRAKQDRTEVEAAAMRLCARLTPGRVPRVLDSDPSAHVVVMELLPEDALNWQAEVALGRAHADAGSWAGETLGLWHAQTEGDPAVAAAFDDFESFEQQRLSPFYETVIEHLPEAADDVARRLEELRVRRCFVDGDFAMKNMLVGSDRNWVLDFEVAHYGNPIFDIGFFLSFVVLSAVRWPALENELRSLAAGFSSAYAGTAGERFAGDEVDVVAHTGCLVLARTDGKSPAQFLDPAARTEARSVGLALLRTPERGLWQRAEPTAHPSRLAPRRREDDDPRA
jgi:5-methylthioribose kinase